MAKRSKFSPEFVIPDYDDFDDFEKNMAEAMKECSSSPASTMSSPEKKNTETEEDPQIIESLYAAHSNNRNTMHVTEDGQVIPQPKESHSTDLPRYTTSPIPIGGRLRNPMSSFSPVSSSNTAAPIAISGEAWSPSFSFSPISPTTITIGGLPRSPKSCFSIVSPPNATEPRNPKGSFLSVSLPNTTIRISSGGVRSRTYHVTPTAERMAPTDKSENDEMSLRLQPKQRLKCTSKQRRAISLETVSESASSNGDGNKKAYRNGKTQALESICSSANEEQPTSRDSKNGIVQANVQETTPVDARRGIGNAISCNPRKLKSPQQIVYTDDQSTDEEVTQLTKSLESKVTFSNVPKNIRLLRGSPIHFPDLGLPRFSNLEMLLRPIAVTAEPPNETSFPPRNSSSSVGTSSSKSVPTSGNNVTPSHIPYFSLIDSSPPELPLLGTSPPEQNWKPFISSSPDDEPNTSKGANDSFEIIDED